MGVGLAMDPFINGSMDPWIHGSMDPWIHGPWMTLSSRSMVLRACHLAISLTGVMLPFVDLLTQGMASTIDKREQHTSLVSHLTLIAGGEPQCKLTLIAGGVSNCSKRDGRIGAECDSKGDPQEIGVAVATFEPRGENTIAIGYRMK